MQRVTKNNGGIEMGETNQVWNDKRRQMLIERLAETLAQIRKEQERLSRGMDEVQIILNSLQESA